ncbi:MAG: TerB family tellurite resistance protein [SAR324 cluster bacterium]|nr:TerB family tellurite resistance protein [SAR324 cluster bacterium]
MGIEREELLDILFLAKQMAGADRSLHPMEKKVLFALFKSVGINQEELETIKHISSPEEAIAGLASEEAKQILIDILVLVASADNEFEEEEQTFITNVMKQLGMSPEEHPYFATEDGLDLEEIRSSVRLIIGNLKDLT